jgi:hypothetical protein
VYVPGVVNVNWNVLPGVMLPEEKAPVSEVTVCVVSEVLFVQVTVSPALMVTAAGANWKLLMVTEAFAAWAGRAIKRTAKASALATRRRAKTPPRTRSRCICLRAPESFW